MGNANLEGKRIAFLMTDGVEQVEFTSPWEAVTDAGGSPTLISPKSDEVQGFNHVDKGDVFAVDVPLSAAKPDDYDALVLPGGVVNADALRVDTDAQAFARAFFDAHKPVAAICHAPWLLIEAGVADGRTLTSYHTLKTDLKNAGATWRDEEVVVDQGLVTSRSPKDLEAFNAKLIEEVGEGRHRGQHV